MKVENCDLLKLYYLDTSSNVYFMKEWIIPINPPLPTCLIPEGAQVILDANAGIVTWMETFPDKS
jgi:hypothetical protein